MAGSNRKWRIDTEFIDAGTLPFLLFSLLAPGAISIAISCHHKSIADLTGRVLLCILAGCGES